MAPQPRHFRRPKIRPQHAARPRVHFSFVESFAQCRGGIATAHIVSGDDTGERLAFFPAAHDASGARCDADSGDGAGAQDGIGAAPLKLLGDAIPRCAEERTRLHLCHSTRRGEHRKCVPVRRNRAAQRGKVVKGRPHGRSADGECEDERLRHAPGRWTEAPAGRKPEIAPGHFPASHRRRGATLFPECQPKHAS